MITVDICPFCGNGDIEIDETESCEYAVSCPECQAVGPICYDIMQAIAAWNKATRLELLDFEIPAST